MGRACVLLVGVFFAAATTGCGGGDSDGDEPETKPPKTTDPDEDKDPSRLPVASILTPSSAPSVRPGVAVDFEGSCSGPEDETSWTAEWDFDDGTTADTTTASHTYSQGGTFVVSLRCTDSTGAVSKPASIEVNVKNDAPTILSATPKSGLVVLPGSTIDVGVVCEDSDDPDDVIGEVSVDGEPVKGNTVQLDDVGEVEVEATCTDQWGETTTLTSLVQVMTPEALYLSREAQLDHNDVMLATVPGSPTVLNASLFAPGGKVNSFVVAGGDVFYAADHEIEGRGQIYRANALDPTAPYAVTSPAAESTPSDLTPSPDGDRFFFYAAQTVPSQADIFWVDATETTPSAIKISPVLVTGQRIEWAEFSPDGRYIGFSIQDTTSGSARWHLYIADLDAGGEVVLLLEDQEYNSAPISFSADEQYAVLGGKRRVEVVDLSTLGAATPTTAVISTAYPEQFVFLGSGALFALVEKQSASADPALYVVDAAAAIAGTDELQALVYDASELQGTFSSSQAVQVCDERVIFTAASESK